MKWFSTAFKVGAGFYLGKLVVLSIPNLPRLWRETIIEYSERDTAPQEIKEYANKLRAKMQKPRCKERTKIVGFTA